MFKTTYLIFIVFIQFLVKPIGYSVIHRPGNQAVGDIEPRPGLSRVAFFKAAGI